MFSLICKLKMVRFVLLGSVAIAPMAMADIATFQHLRTNEFFTPTPYTGVRDTELLAGGFADYNAGARTTMQWNPEREVILRFGDLNVMAGQYASINSAKIVLTKATLSEPTSPFPSTCSRSWTPTPVGAQAAGRSGPHYPGKQRGTIGRIRARRGQVVPV